MSSEAAAPPATSLAQNVSRRVLGTALAAAGVGHLTWLREEFQSQVPPWFPADEDFVVVSSGVVEVALGTALVLADKQRVPVGWATAGFFVVIFPGNIAQFVEGRNAFGLRTDRARAIRLAFQPALVAAALWSTGAWGDWRARRSR